MKSKKAKLIEKKSRTVVARDWVEGARVWVWEMGSYW